MDLTEVVQQYYEWRKYKAPDATESLFWLISEVGELASAHLSKPEANITRYEKLLLNIMVAVGRKADEHNSRKGGWVRNNGRLVDNITPTRIRISREIADVLMMLTVYANNNGIEPEQALIEKMASKGFVIENNPWDGSATTTKPLK